MGIVFGYLSLICFCMLVAKWIARRCNLIKFDKVLMRIHRPVSLLLIVFCILHISFVIPVLRNRNVLVNVSGVLQCHLVRSFKKRHSFLLQKLSVFFVIIYA